MDHASIATVQYSFFGRKRQSIYQIKRLEQQFSKGVYEQCILNQRHIVSDLSVRIPPSERGVYSACGNGKEEALG